MKNGIDGNFCLLVVLGKFVFSFSKSNMHLEVDDSKKSIQVRIDDSQEESLPKILKKTEHILECFDAPELEIKFKKSH